MGIEIVQYFVDTSAFYAAKDPSDQHHAQAVAFMERVRKNLSLRFVSNSRFGVVSPLRTAHKPKRGDSVRGDGPREQNLGLQLGRVTSLILPNEASGSSPSGN